MAVDPRRLTPGPFAQSMPRVRRLPYVAGAPPLNLAHAWRMGRIRRSPGFRDISLVYCAIARPRRPVPPDPGAIRPH